MRAHFDRVFASQGLTPPTQSVEMLWFDAAEQMLSDCNSVGLLTYGEAGLHRLLRDLEVVELQLTPDLANARVVIGLIRLAAAAPDAAIAACQAALMSVLTEAGEIG